MSKRTELFIEFNKEIKEKEVLFGQILFGVIGAGKYSIQNPIKKKPLMNPLQPDKVLVEVIETAGLFVTCAEQYVEDPSSLQVLKEYREILIQKNEEMLNQILTVNNDNNQYSREEVQSAVEAFADLVNHTTEVEFSPAKTTVKFIIPEDTIDTDDLNGVNEALNMLSKEIDGLELLNVYIQIHEVTNVDLFSK